MIPDAAAVNRTIHSHLYLAVGTKPPRRIVGRPLIHNGKKPNK